MNRGKPDCQAFSRMYVESCGRSAGGSLPSLGLRRSISRILRGENGNTGQTVHMPATRQARKGISAQTRADVIIIGAGIAGLAAASALGETGQSVIVIE